MKKAGAKISSPYNTISSPSNKLHKLNHSPTLKQKYTNLIQFKSSGIDGQNFTNAVAVCPNCLFHFKITIKVQTQNRHRLHTIESTQKAYSLQDTINRQYSRISSDISKKIVPQLSPSSRLAYKQQLQEQIRNKQMKSLSRLRKLNQFSHLQKTSPAPISSPQTSPRKPTQKVFSFTVFQQKARLDQIPNLQKSKKQQSQSKFKVESIKSDVFYRYSIQNLLNHLLDWTKSTQQFYSLPTYLRLLIQNYNILTESK